MYCGLTCFVVFRFVSFRLVFRLACVVVCVVFAVLCLLVYVRDGFVVICLVFYVM